MFTSPTNPHPGEHSALQGEGRGQTYVTSPAHMELGTPAYLRFPQLRPPRPNGQLRVDRKKKNMENPQGQKSLAGYSTGRHKELDTTE